MVLFFGVGAAIGQLIQAGYCDSLVPVAVEDVKPVDMSRLSILVPDRSSI